MAYSDYPGEFLVNNLNLILIGPNSQVYVGNGQSGANLAPDTTNNAEVIHVKRPRKGMWVLRIVASNVPQGPQDYAFVLSGNVRA